MNPVTERLAALAHSGPLPVEQALGLADEISDLAKQEASSLEMVGQFEDAANLYEQAARAFQIAAEKVPAPDREQVASLAEFWLVKADMTRYRVHASPSPLST
ncbi:MAG TPA: hypothetical protein ENN99_06775, partial [Chloroflexi bacterium]|nr:hypothetical protein [Chloroflexota bacterium]